MPCSEDVSEYAVRRRITPGLLNGLFNLQTPIVAIAGVGVVYSIPS